MRSFARARRLVLTTLGVVLLAAVYSGVALAGSGTFSTSSTSAVRAGTTGAPATLSVTLRNTSVSTTSYKLGSANLTLPGCPASPAPPCAGGFVLQQGAATVTNVGGGANWSAKVVGNVVQIRTPEKSSNYLPPQKSITVNVTVLAAPTVTGAFALAAQVAKNDGDFDASTLTPGGVASFTVLSGPLHYFAWTQQPGGQQQAGVAFGAQLTAYDVYGNVKTDYAGSGSLTGLGTSPNGSQPTGLGPQAFAAGVASVSVTDYSKESATLTYADGAIAASSSTISVAAGTFSVAFATQPGNAFVGQTIPSTTSGQPISVSAQDAWGNTPDNGSTITLATSPSVSLAGTNPAATTGGRAQFANLAIATANTYVLGATLNGDGQVVGPVTSDSFVVTTSGVSCTAPCTAPSLTEASTGLTSTVAASGSSGTLNVGFVPSQNYCGGFTPIGSITDFQLSGGTTPSFDITWSVKFSNSLNPALIAKRLSSVDICLGTINTATGTGPGFAAKNGQTAQLQSDGFYWGLVASCGSVPSGNPCIYARSKIVVTINGVTNGTVTVKFRVPYPWDGRYGGG